jgi:hypothetical protein
MSHVSVRLLADRFADAEHGVNAIAAHVPRFTGDEIPPEVAIYDETRHGWVARGQVPREDVLITFPCFILFLQSIVYESGIPADTDTGARIVKGTATIVAQLLVRDVDTEMAAAMGMYLLRAGRGVLVRFDDPQLTPDPDREACAMRLFPATSVQQGQLKAPAEDTVVSPGALVITYPFIETVPVEPL